MHDCLPSRRSRRDTGPGHQPPLTAASISPACGRATAGRPQALDVQADGLVSKSDREGASPSGPANFMEVRPI